MGSGKGGAGGGGGGGGRSQPLTEANIESIKAYTAESDINDVLNAGNALTAAEKRVVAELNNSLDKLPNHTGEVYRVLDFRQAGKASDFLNSHEVGSVVKYKAFTSTSTDRGIWSQSPVRAKDTRVQLTIRSKTGKNIQKYSFYKGEEREVLFKTGAKFRVTSKSTSGNVTSISLREI